MTSAEQKAMMLAALERINSIDHSMPRDDHGAGSFYQSRLSMAQDIVAKIIAALAEQPAPSVGDEERAERLAKIIDLSTENGGAMVCETSYEGDMQSLSIPAATKLISQAFAAIRSESALTSRKPFKGTEMALVDSSLNKIKINYKSKLGFADPDYAVLYRRFVRDLEEIENAIAVTTAQPAVQKDEVRDDIETIKGCLQAYANLGCATQATHGYAALERISAANAQAKVPEDKCLWFVVLWDELMRPFNAYPFYSKDDAEFYARFNVKNTVFMSVVQSVPQLTPPQSPPAENINGEDMG